MVVPVEQRSCQFRIVNNVSQALKILAEHYFNFVVLDNRRAKATRRTEDCFKDSLALNFMDKVHHSGDPERMYPLARIFVVLERDACLADQAFVMGKRRIGGYVVNPFDGSLFDKMTGAIEGEGPGKSALCLAGGGVEGLLFEIGVLKALNAHLQSRSVVDFDIFCGISAGSMITSLLANGTEPEDMAAATTGAQQSSLDPMTPKIMLDPHLGEYAGRMWALGKTLPVRSWEQMVSGLLKTVPTGFFRGETLKAFIAKQLAASGRTDDFRRLSKELYIGATDQDTSAHVVFCKGGQWEDVPISQAVRASTALTPFFEPEMIRGRYFVDGQYTRTSNFHIAVEKGATLVIVVNPLIPIKVDQPGYVREKGGVFAGIQALKAVIHTRFMHAIRHAVENNPNVDFVLFTPENEDMKLMSGSPMKYNVRTEIINAAYRFTVRKIQRDFEILSGTFAKHGFRLQRHPRLRATHHEVY
jgi:NTE family protein